MPNCLILLATRSNEDRKTNIDKDYTLTAITCGQANYSHYELPQPRPCKHTAGSLDARASDSSWFNFFKLHSEMYELYGVRIRGRGLILGMGQLPSSESLFTVWSNLLVKDCTPPELKLSTINTRNHLHLPGGLARSSNAHSHNSFSHTVTNTFIHNRQIIMSCSSSPPSTLREVLIANNGYHNATSWQHKHSALYFQQGAFIEELTQWRLCPSTWKYMLTISHSKPFDSSHTVLFAMHLNYCLSGTAPRRHIALR